MVQSSHKGDYVKEIDPNDAPEGYKAVRAEYLCGKCKFMRKDCANMSELRCTPGLRKDGCLIIFVKDEEKE